MKYSNQIEINLPVQKVIELFDNQANITKWQAECVSYNHVSGTPGQIGAKTLFVIEHEFLFTNLMMKLMGAVMPGAFKNQTKKYLNNFKSFAETEGESNG